MNVLIDEAKAATRQTGTRSTLDVLMDELDPVNADEVRELLLAPVVGAQAAARVLTKHYGESAGRPISRLMVQRWRERERLVRSMLKDFAAGLLVLLIAAVLFGVALIVVAGGFWMLDEATR